MANYNPVSARIVFKYQAKRTMEGTEREQHNGVFGLKKYKIKGAQTIAQSDNTTKDLSGSVHVLDASWSRHQSDRSGLQQGPHQVSASQQPARGTSPLWP